MPGFLYFLPGEKESELVRNEKLQLDCLAKWQLHDALSDCELSPDHVLVRTEKGPDGTMGLLLVPRPLDGSIPVKTYQPQHQEWREAQDPSGKWIGWFKEQPPGPQDLVKRTALGGKYVVHDANDNEWMVVTARSEQGVALPCTYTFVGDELTTKVRPRYRALWELSGHIYDHMAVLFAGDESNKQYMKDESYLVLAALEILSTNYRVSKSEVAILDELEYELLKTETVTALLMCFVDQPTLDEFKAWNRALEEKKSTDLARSFPSCSSGSEDSTHPTVQPDVAS